MLISCTPWNNLTEQQNSKIYCLKLLELTSKFMPQCLESCFKSLSRKEFFYGLICFKVSLI